MKHLLFILSWFYDIYSSVITAVFSILFTLYVVFGGNISFKLNMTHPQTVVVMFIVISTTSVYLYLKLSKFLRKNI